MSDGVTIRKSWRTLAVIPLALFAVVWDGILVFLYIQLLSKHHAADLAVVFFPSIHVAVGVVLTYYVLASLVNNTDLVVTLAGVQVHIYPMPWPGNRHVGAQEITDVIVRERTSYNNRRARSSYAVMYAGESRKERKLISYPQSDQAEFAANAIRAALNIKPEDS